MAKIPVNDLTRQVAELSPAKRALLEKKRKRSEVPLAAPAILPREKREQSPLSFAQQRLWLIQQLDPASCLYNVPRAIRIKGPLSISALEQSLNEIVRRHEVLRSTFVVEDDQPVQKTAPEMKISLGLVHLNDLQPDEHEHAIQRLLLEESRQPFDLARGPLLRTRLLHLSDDDHVLLLVMHHIVSDGWTGGILFNELGALYEAFSTGQQSSLRGLPVQYADYAIWQREWMQGAVLEQELAYWRGRLEASPALLDLPTDRVRPTAPSYRGSKSGTLLSNSLSQELKAFSRQNGVTLFPVLLTALQILLFRWSEQDDFVVGTVSANRNQTEIENLIGCFVNFLPLRCQVKSDETGLALLHQVKQVVLAAFAHQDCPFEKIIEAVNPQRALNVNPLYNVGLLMQNFPEIAFRNDLLEARFLTVETEVAFLDLRFVATDSGDALSLECEYNVELFNHETIDALINGYREVLQQLVAQPDTKLAEFRFLDALTTQARAARRREQKQTIAIASTFTAEPLEESLAFWMQQLGIPSEIEFAPYNQVFQQLLDPASLLAGNTNGANIVLVRLDDWIKDPVAPSVHQHVERNVGELITALKTAAGRSAVAFEICICPPSKAAIADPASLGFYQRMEILLASELNETPGIHVITSAQLLDLYPVADYDDEFANKLGHIPYTPALFTALGTMIARRIHNLRSQPFKVIVLDCDQTLWKGVCGEDGPLGIEVDASRRALQDFMIKQHEAGMILCLCSKNAEEDVTAVFEQNSDMVLQSEHIVASRINWFSKSQNLKELAVEVGLGLDSFIFLDDNSLECAEVRAHCPEVLTLQLPEDVRTIPTFLRHVWAFDHWKITEEDKKRAALYRQHIEREQVQKEAPSLEDFLAELELKIDIRSMQPDDLPRVAQLTERTNQFNFTTIRRTESEIKNLCQTGAECLVVDLRDRFGDYGLVGVLIFSGQPDAIRVDTFLLSCRALGRKVEHHMLARLGEIAQQRDLARVDVTYLPTKKNRPAVDFLESAGAQVKTNHDGHFVYLFTAEQAATAEKLNTTDIAAASASYDVTPTAPSLPASEQPAQTGLLAHIASQLSNVDSIALAIDSQKTRQLRSPDDYLAPRTPTEEILAAIWGRLLRIEKIGIQHNFFVLGGHSLLATQVIARIRQTLGVELPVRAMFEAPTIAELAERLETARRSERGWKVPPLVRLPRETTLQPSFAQQRLWFLDQLEPGNPIYNIPQTIRMRGVLNAEALQQSINEIVNRHEALRTTLVTVDDEPMQLIVPELKLPLPIIDLTHLGDNQREVEAQRLATTEALRPFDLSQGPLLRATLLRLSPETHVLLLNMHHVVSDRWSMGVLAEELAALYTAFSQNKPSPLPQLPVQYADYALWQRQWLQGETLGKQIAYWKSQLADAPSVLEFPTDRPRPALQTYCGSTQTRLLPSQLIQRLTTLSHGEGVTLFMTLLSAFQTLLSRYSGQENIVVGSPIANRNYAEIEPLIGFFVNTLALRSNLAGDPTFRELLARVREVSLAAYAHQDIPFEKLVEELQPERSVSHHPIFQVLFALQNAPMQAIELPGLRLERMPVYTGTSMFDMSWFAIEVPEGLLLRAEYNTDLFDNATVTRALDNFQILLEGIVEHPECRISELPLLTEDERQQILIEFNATTVERPNDICLHQLFEAQVEKTPEAIALICGQQCLTYGELNRRANQLAHHLRTLGVGPDVLVGVCTHRSVEMVVALYGIVKAGGAYVPLDPDYPQERLAWMLEDAKPKVLLTQASLLDLLPPYFGPLICLDRDWETIAREADNNPPRLVKDKDLAYAIYTSGSTGKPKGVPNIHQAIVNRLLWMQETYPLTGSDRVLQKTPYSFDVSVWEFFWPLMTGACLVIARPDGHKDPDYLLNVIAEERITTLHFVPSMLQIFLQAENLERCSSLRRVFCSGEALPLEVQQQFFERCTAELHNLYGPTEVAVDVTSWACHPDYERSIVPIGRPIANTQIYLLDKNLHPVPIGVTGELHIGGIGLARGYLNRTELTAEKFITDPFSSNPAARLYKTGDLARFLPDGNIEYLGRIDHQVKIRGFRIELGEIESVLDRHPAVRQSVVMAREDKPGNKRLVAYLVVEGSSAPAVEELRHYLGKTLPEFMVPAAFVTMEAFPLSANGKVNRRSLPVPEYLRPELQSAYVAPRTPVEEKLATIWSEVLHLQQVGVHDNFFAVGGHSLLATQVISRVRRTFAVDLPLRAMFEAPSIARLATRIDTLHVSSERLPQLRKLPRSQPLPLSFAQQRLWFLNQLEPNNPLYNVPLAIRMKGELHGKALDRALNEIVRRHEVLRTTFVAIDGNPLQVIAPEMMVDIPTVDISAFPSEEQQIAVQRLAVEGAQQLFDLKTGPLFRANLLRLGSDDHVLLLNTHHIASDGWSMWQFIKELAALYEVFLQNRPSPLPELAVQYADYAVWQREWMQSGVTEKQLSYWKQKLEGAPDTLELPADRLRPAIQNYNGATETVIFPRALTDKLNHLSQQEGATLFMTLLAVYQTLLFRYTGQEDVVVGTPIANRNRFEIEELIGFFVNTLVMRTDLSGDPTFRLLLHRVHDVALGAYAHQDLPFEKLVEALQPERDLGRTPLFQVWFALQNAPRSVFKLSGLELASMDVHNGTSKFDLGFFMIEKPDGLSCMVEYSTDLFEASTIQRLLGHFRVLLEGITANPDQRISELPLLSEKERQQVLMEFNATSVDYPQDVCVHDFFEQQVERTPHAVAVISDQQRMSYQELNRRANQLAHFLQKRSIGPESLVGICMERSIEMLIGIMGILKTGAAYVPLDPAYPKQRLAGSLEDAKASLLITQESLIESLPSETETICLDRDWSVIACESEANPVRQVKPENLAYVLFTSGSTGRPKGVALEHRSAATFIHWAQTVFTPQQLEGVLFSTSICFDLSVFEMFVPLSVGGKLILAQNALYLPTLAAKNDVTLINTVPSAIAELVRMNGVPASVKTVNLAGEALPDTLVEEIYASTSVQKVYNLYGPTEATTYSTYTLVPRGASVTIGVPIANTQAYILDAHLNPVPVGVPGELYLAGAGLARGYFGRPELTAERFVTNPFSSQNGCVMYRTGDLCHWLSDGNIQYLGRMDNQVKLRGFRIELGEIEVMLARHPGVRQCVVMAREDEPGNKRLVAYIVPDVNYRGSDQSTSEDIWSSEQVSQWAMTFDEAYREGGSASDATFNIAGWNSSYTNQPISPEEMRVWVEATSERILSLRPQQVWEIGCGTGLLLFRIAPHCESYHGTDISQTAINFLHEQLQRPELMLPKVSLEQRPAHEFDGDRFKNQFDTVVLNSVTHYFPDVEYLINVVKGAVESVQPGGTVFIGDVRSLPLLESFHTSVQLYQAPESLTREELSQRVQKSVRHEPELVVDPRFFNALQHHIPQISSVEIQLKRGRARNELTCFRYDVTLRVNSQPSAKIDCAWLDWNKQGLIPELVREIVQKTEPDMLGLTAVPNGRLQADIQALQMLTSREGPLTAGELREALNERVNRAGVEPEDLWALERDLPYSIEIRPSIAAIDGCCDVVLRRKAASGAALDWSTPRFPGETDVVRPWETYANNPLRQRVASNLIPQLHRWLAGSLPEYMLPSNFLLVDSMPLSSNGKVNRKALAALYQAQPEGQTQHVMPRTPVEEVLVSIWADVLRVDRVGAEDNFFELGGHSLTATQVVSRVREAFHVELPLKALFESPTITALAATIERMQRAVQGLPVPPIVPLPRNQAFPLSFAQQRLWFLHQLEPNNSLYNVPRTIRMQGTLHVQALEKALNGLVQRHEVLRTNYRMIDDQPVQVISPSLTIKMPTSDLSALPIATREDEARRIANQVAATPFDLERDPALHALLIRLAPQDHILLLNTHHISSDGWSTGVILGDLGSLYEAALEDKPPSLPELPIQYADYAVWQRHWLQGEVLEKQLAYWKARLDGAPPLLSIPTDRPRPAVQTFRGATQSIVFSQPLVDGIRLFSRQQGVTLFMTMLAGFQSLLRYYTRQSDIVLGTDVANRTNVQTESLIGFFVNLLVLRTDLSGDPTFHDLLGRVREVTLGAYAHQDVPFDKLVEEFQPERSLSHTPLVQVLFVQQNTPRQNSSLPGLKLSAFKMDVASKFDMAVFVSGTDKSLALSWLYNPDLFDASTIARMAELYQTVLEKMASNPDMKLSSLLEFLAEIEQQQRLTEEKQYQEASLSKLKKTKRRAIAEV